MPLLTGSIDRLILGWALIASHLSLLKLFANYKFL